jgi:hypothetical protein
VGEIESQLEREYELPRSGVDQKAWWEEVGYKIKACQDCHSAFRLRKGLYKRYVEEATPIAHFTAHRADFRNAEVIMHPGNQSFDAEVKVRGGTEYVEVVNAEDGHLFNVTAKLLNKFGVAPGTVSRGISKLKDMLKSDSTPEWFGDVIHGFEEHQRIEKRLVSEIEKKIAHGYTGTFHLLAGLNLDCQFDELSEMAARLKAKFAAQKAFASITIFERRSAKVVQVLP